MYSFVHILPSDVKTNQICPLYLDSRAGSVLTETEEPPVLDDYFGTETEMEPNFARFRNRERFGTEISEPRVPEVCLLLQKCAILTNFI